MRDRLFLDKLAVLIAIPVIMSGCEWLPLEAKSYEDNRSPKTKYRSDVYVPPNTSFAVTTEDGYPGSFIAVKRDDGKTVVRAHPFKVNEVPLGSKGAYTMDDDGKVHYNGR